MSPSSSWPPSKVRFHDLWSAAVGGPQYNKSSWQALEERYSCAYADQNFGEVEKILAEAEQLCAAHQRGAP